MSRRKAKIIQHVSEKIDIGALFCRAQYSHDSFFFEDKLKILKGAESIHFFVGSNSLFDKIYLVTADALINPEALDLLKKAKRVLFLYEGSPECEHPASIADLNHLYYFKSLFKHLEDFNWESVKNSNLGDTVKVYIFIIS